MSVRTATLVDLVVIPLLPVVVGRASQIVVAELSLSKMSVDSDSYHKHLYPRPRDRCTARHS
jgi:hypothetical protein